MSTSSLRSGLTSIIGWVIVVIVAWMVFGWFFATLRWILRTVLILIVLGLLVSAYARLTDDTTAP